MSGNNQPTSFLDTFKSGSKRFATLVADTGAKTMLKVRLLYVCWGHALFMVLSRCILLFV